jgi:hypothetical protein
MSSCPPAHSKGCRNTTDTLSAIADARARIDAGLTRKAWEDDDFRRRFVADPKAMIAEFLGQPLPVELSVSVHEETPGSLHFVISGKPSPQALDELDDADLEKIAGGTEPISSIASIAISTLLSGIFAAAITSFISVTLTKHVVERGKW